MKRTPLNTAYGAGTAAGATPQTQPSAGAAEVQMRSGGYGFEVNEWTKLERFLMIGTEGNSYYAKNQTLTMENARNVERLVRTNGDQVIEYVKSVSATGRAPKNDQALFVLAACASFGSQTTRSKAYEALPQVARTGTHLFQFIEFFKSMKSKDGKKMVANRGLRLAIAHWLLSRSVDKTAYQLLKYQQREGWSMRDVLRISHTGSYQMWGKKTKIKGYNEAFSALFRYVTKGYDKLTPEQKKLLPALVYGFELAKVEKDEAKLITVIKYYRLTREMIPTEFQSNKNVQEALLLNGGVPLGALVRNLGNMTKSGLLVEASDAEKFVLKQLQSKDYIRASRLHPMAILKAMHIYQAGRGGSFKGKEANTWKVNQSIVSALDEAFYLAFVNAPVTNKRFLLACDVSGSMTAKVSGVPGMSCREATAAMALVTMATEPNALPVAFTASEGMTYQQAYTASRAGRGQPHDGIQELKISPKMRLDEAQAEMQRLPFGGTDCALPMLYALEKKLPIDCFVVYTDNESWAGRIKPFEALKKYREEMKIPARFVAIAFSADRYSIADPSDAGMMDMTGLDAAMPALIADFVSDGKYQAAGADDIEELIEA